MIQAGSSTLPLDRARPQEVAASQTNRANDRSEATAAPLTPAAQGTPDVEVSISVAAQAAAARDNIRTTTPAATDRSEAVSAAQAPDTVREAANAAAPRETISAHASSLTAQAQAAQKFADTAGIGLEQQNASPLRVTA